MNLRLVGIFSILFIIYAAANYYVGLRFFQTFRSLIEPYSLFFWSGYALLAVLPFAARFGRRYFRRVFNNAITIIGDYWLAAIYYFFLSWAVFDILRLAARLVSATGWSVQEPAQAVGISILLLITALLLYGTWNAQNPRLVHYNIAIKKTIPDLPQLHAVMVSDIHLGVIVGTNRLTALVNRINELAPDIVFLVGDTVDEDVNLLVEQKMAEVLSKLQTKYGVFAVMGNHEYIGGNSRLAVKYLKQANVTMLQDQYSKVNDQFYIVGRDDRRSGSVNGKPRLALDDVVRGIDHSLPIILLDHQPYDLAESQRNKIDLQLSGHTHNGQFFPNNLITQRIFEKDWGYLRKGDYQVIVSSGFGTWGPPIRIGNYPEIIDITITFAE